MQHIISHVAPHTGVLITCNWLRIKHLVVALDSKMYDADIPYEMVTSIPGFKEFCVERKKENLLPMLVMLLKILEFRL